MGCWWYGGGVDRGDEHNDEEEESGCGYRLIYPPMLFNLHGVPCWIPI